MEEAFNSGNLRKVADFYLDDAHLIRPETKRLLPGLDIDEYWTNIKSPVKWEFVLDLKCFKVH